MFGSARVWEGALNAAPRFRSFELALNRFLHPLHPFWPPEEENFLGASGSSLLLSPRGRHPPSSRQARSMVPPKSDRSPGSL